jgi:hypothetical protein
MRRHSTKPNEISSYDVASGLCYLLGTLSRTVSSEEICGEICELAPQCAMHFCKMALAGRSELVSSAQVWRNRSVGARWDHWRLGDWRRADVKELRRERNVAVALLARQIAGGQITNEVCPVRQFFRSND